MKKITVKCVTFNLGHPYHNNHYKKYVVGGKKSTRRSELEIELSGLIKAMMEEDGERPDMLVFAFQEARVKTGRKVFYWFGGKAKAENWRSFRRVRKVLRKYLNAHNYELLGYESNRRRLLTPNIKAHQSVSGLGSKGIYTFIAKRINSDIKVTNVEKESIRYGKYDTIKRVLANKGAILVKFTAQKNGRESTFSFVNCHNNADSPKKNTRDLKSCLNLSAGPMWNRGKNNVDPGVLQKRAEENGRTPADYQIVTGDFNPRLLPGEDPQNLFKKAWLRSTKIKDPSFLNLFKGKYDKKLVKAITLHKNQLVHCNKMYEEVFKVSARRRLGLNKEIANAIANRETLLQNILGKRYNFSTRENPVPDSLSEVLSEELKKPCGFREHVINFAPSYPFDPLQNSYDPDKKKDKGRVASYCDRILFKNLLQHEADHKRDMICNGYGCYFEAQGSDHRPVYADFTMKLRTTSHAERQQGVEMTDLSKSRNRRVTLVD